MTIETRCVKVEEKDFVLNVELRGEAETKLPLKDASELAEGADVKSLNIGKRSARLMRQDGFLPAVVYGSGVEAGSKSKEKAQGGKPESLSVVLNSRQFVRLATRSKSSQIFNISSSVDKLNGMKVIVQDIQKDHLKGKVLHVDLQALEESTLVKLRIPLKVVGEAFGVKNEGGVLTTSARSITVRCLPKNIPSIVEVDISDLRIGGRVRTRDIQLPEGVELRSNPLETVANIVAGRKAKADAQEGGADAKAA